MRFGLVLVLLAACGDGIGAPDATPPTDSNAGLVRVQFRSSVPAGNPVFFQNADSSMVLATRTDASGSANAYMSAGGFVTLLQLTGGTRRINTWSAVQPGDTLVFDDPNSAPAESTSITLSIPVDPGASFYQLYSSCGPHDVRAAAGSQLIVELDGCSPKANMFVVAFGAGFHYLYAQDVPISDGGSVYLPSPYRAMERSTIAVVNAPSAALQVDVSQSLVGEGFGTGSIPLTDGTGAINIDMALPVEASVVTQADLVGGGGIGSPHVIRWERGQPTTTIDFAAGALRKLTERPVYQRTTHTLQWAEETDGVIANAVLATFGWSRPAIGGNYQWQIFAPRGEETVIHLPVLPGDLLPREHDVILEPINYPFASMSVGGGYDRIRTRVLGAWSPGRAWPADGATGTVVYQDLTPMQFPPD